MSNVNFELPTEKFGASAATTSAEIPVFTSSLAVPADISVIQEGLFIPTEKPQEAYDSQEVVIEDDASFAEVEKLATGIDIEDAKANIIRDTTVRATYGESISRAEAFQSVSAKAYEDTVAIANERVARATEENREFHADLQESLEHAINTLIDQYRRKVEGENSRFYEKQVASAELVKEAGVLHRNNERAISNIKTMAILGLNEQQSHELSRNKAMNTLNKLAIEERDLLEKVEKSDKKIEKNTARLVELEKIRSGLLRAKDVLVVKEEEEVEKYVAESLKSAFADMAIDIDSQDLPAPIQAYIDGARERASSDKLVTIRSKIESLDESLTNNKISKDHKGSNLDLAELEKSEALRRLAEIPAERAAAQAMYDHEVTAVAEALNNNSLNLKYAAETLEQINMGDTSAVAGTIIPSILKSVWESKGKEQKALTATDASPVEWPEANFDTEVPLALRSEGDDTYNVSDLEVIPKAIQEFKQIPHLDIKGTIKRGLAKAGLDLTYRHQGSDQHQA